MSHFDAGNLNAEDVQCFVCEKAITRGNGFARLKHGEWTVVVCSEPCAKAFQAQRLPYLRRIEVLAAFNAQNPHGYEFSPLND